MAADPLRQQPLLAGNRRQTGMQSLTIWGAGRAHIAKQKPVSRPAPVAPSQFFESRLAAFEFVVQVDQECRGALATFGQLALEFGIVGCEKIIVARKLLPGGVVQDIGFLKASGGKSRSRSNSRL